MAIRGERDSHHPKKSLRIDLICRGIRLISADDQKALDRGAVIYDALYAALREQEAEKE